MVQRGVLSVLGMLLFAQIISSGNVAVAAENPARMRRCLVILSFFRFASSTPKEFRDYSQQHKFAVVDGKRVLFGSHNWSRAANIQNDETFMVLEADGIASTFSAEFERLYGKSVLGRPDWLLKKISDKEKKCGVVPSLGYSGSTNW